MKTKLLFVSFLLGVTNFCLSQNSYTILNELMSLTHKNIYTVYSYDELGNMRTRNVSMISGSDDIANEYVSIQHQPTFEAIDIVFSDFSDEVNVLIYNENLELVWQYLYDDIEEVFLNPMQLADNQFKTVQLNSIMVDVSSFKPGKYYVNVFDIYGVQHARKEIEISSKTNIEDVLLPKPMVVIYPNPTKGSLFIESSDDIKEISIYSVHGKLLERLEVKAAGSIIELTRNGVQSGIYIVNVSTAKGVSTHKVVFEQD